MVKKRELGIAILCLVILVLILFVLLGFILLVQEILKNIGAYSVMSLISSYVGLGAAIGISAGFGYIIAQKLFDALLNK